MSGFGEELQEAEDPWDVLDGEDGLLHQAVELYSEKFPANEEIDFECVYAGVDRFHLYELRAPTMDEPLVLKISPSEGKGFSVCNMTDRYETKYRNLFRYGVAELM